MNKHYIFISSLLLSQVACAMQRQIVPYKDIVAEQNNRELSLNRNDIHLNNKHSIYAKHFGYDCFIYDKKNNSITVIYTDGNKKVFNLEKYMNNFQNNTQHNTQENKLVIFDAQRNNFDKKIMISHTQQSIMPNVNVQNTEMQDIFNFFAAIPTSGASTNDCSIM